MNEKRRKEYTLYVFFRNISIPIMKNTIDELDDLTTYFESPAALAKLYLRNFVSSNENYSFYIESSRGTRYNVLLNDCRFILNSNNKKDIIEWLIKLPVEDLIMYIENNTKIFNYMESDKRNSIPLYNLYNFLFKEDEKYINLLSNMLKSDYKFYRDITKFFKNKMPNFPSIPIDKVKKQKIKLSSEQIYYNICNEINTAKVAESSVNEDDGYNIDIEDEILNIINKSGSVDDIITEIELIIPDEEKRRYYLGKYKSLIHRLE